jgi:uncharacterized protein CbrC (UPF0167 family)
MPVILRLSRDQFGPQLKTSYQSNQMSLPSFKYHPNPVATGMIERKTAVCPCCERTTEYVYSTIPYGIDEIENLCPECIENGSAAKKFKVEFSDGYPLAQVGLAKEIVEEVIFRTPGFISWQQEVWLACCDDACEFHGNLSKDEFKNLSSEKIAKFREDHDIGDKLWGALSSSYVPKGNLAIYKFVCRHCGSLRLGFDMS